MFGLKVYEKCKIQKQNVALNLNLASTYEEDASERGRGKEDVAQNELIIYCTKKICFLSL